MRGVSQVGCRGTRPPCSITRKPAASGNCGGFDGGSAKSPRLQASWLATQSKLAIHLMVSGFLLVEHSREDVVVWCAILAATRFRRSRNPGISAMLRSHVGRPVLGLALPPVVPCRPPCSRCVAILGAWRSVCPLRLAWPSSPPL